MGRRARPLLLALLLSAMFAGLAARLVQLHTELTDFLPEARDDAAALLLREAREGDAARLILIGIENGSDSELVRLSRGLSEALSRTDLFVLVRNGQTQALDTLPLFDRRLLLSPVVTEEAFSPEALARSLATLKAGLQSAASPVLAQWAPADPIGAYPAMAAGWLGEVRVRSVEGVWLAEGPPARAVLIAETRASGTDVAGQDRAVTAVERGFAGLHPGGARLLLAGPAVFARDAARAIRADIFRVSLLSAAAVGVLLIWRFRNALVIAAIATPVVLGMALAALVVQALWGFVHGIALGFGMTMLGVTVDYPVIFIGHRKPGEAARGTLARIGGTFALAVTTALLGLSGLAFAEVPGLSQLGAFAAVGVLGAALATWFLLPIVVVRAGLAPVWADAPGTVLRLERGRAWRWHMAGAVLLVGVVALAAGRVRLERDPTTLSPVPRADLMRDAALRADLGVPDAGQFAVVRGASAELVLRREEQLQPILDRLRATHVIAGAQMAATLLPSVATQRSRQAALPAPDVLRDRLRAAATPLGFRADAFAPFVADVGVARAAAPVTPEAVGEPVLAEPLRALLVHRGDTVLGFVPLRGVADPAAAAQALMAPDVVYVDAAAATASLVARATALAWRWLALGGAAAVLCLLVGLRDIGRVARVLIAVLSGLALTEALLGLAGQAISLVDLVGLQFVAGIGLDYALFFGRRQSDDEERARTLRTLSTCVAMTVLTFGALALSHTPLLRDLGRTVAVGAMATMCTSFMFAGTFASPGPKVA